MPLSKQEDRLRKRQERTGTVQPNPVSPYIINVKRRREILSDIAEDYEGKRTNPVEAIKELNKLGGDYPPEQHLVAHKVIFEIVHVKKKQLVVEIPGTTTSSIEGEIIKEEENGRETEGTGKTTEAETA